MLSWLIYIVLGIGLLTLLFASACRYSDKKLEIGNQWIEDKTKIKKWTISEKVILFFSCLIQLTASLFFRRFREEVEEIKNKKLTTDEIERIDKYGFSYTQENKLKKRKVTEEYKFEKMDEIYKRLEKSRYRPTDYKMRYFDKYHKRYYKEIGKG